jgi:hypothetical protein
MSVSVRGANSPVRILVSNGKSSNKVILSSHVLYFSHRKPNDILVEANPDVPI